GIGTPAIGAWFSRRLALDYQGGDTTSDKANNMRVQDSNWLLITQAYPLSPNKHYIVASAGLFIVVTSTASLPHQTTFHSEGPSSARTTRNSIKMVRFFTFAATLAFAFTALTAPSPQSCGGTAIGGSDCSFNDQCRSCRCINGICARANLMVARQCGGTAIPGSDCGFDDQCRSCHCDNGICA
ncbi:hypothetical protein BCR34DRAFT_501261, partial [Clohesyomyces aquaticus]